MERVWPEVDRVSEVSRLQPAQGQIWDAASVELLTHLLRRFRGPLLTAVAYRPGRTRMLAALEATARTAWRSRLELAPLSAEEVQALFGPEIDDATRAILFRESGGNPFYIEQLARATRARPGRPRPGSRRSREQVPSAVIAAIRDEVVAVSAEARRVLEGAAVAGESFEPELVSAIAEHDMASVLAAFDDLLELDLIRPTDAPRRFRFRHPIVRRAVYDAIPQGWRIGAHARAGLSIGARSLPLTV